MMHSTEGLQYRTPPKTSLLATLKTIIDKYCGQVHLLAVAPHTHTEQIFLSLIKVQPSSTRITHIDPTSIQFSLLSEEQEKALCLTRDESHLVNFSCWMNKGIASPIKHHMYSEHQALFVRSIVRTTDNTLQKLLELLQYAATHMPTHAKNDDTLEKHLQNIEAEAKILASNQTAHAARVILDPQRFLEFSQMPTMDFRQYLEEEKVVQKTITQRVLNTFLNTRSPIPLYAMPPSYPIEKLLTTLSVMLKTLPLTPTIHPKGNGATSKRSDPLCIQELCSSFAVIKAYVDAALHIEQTNHPSAESAATFVAQNILELLNGVHASAHAKAQAIASDNESAQPFSRVFTALQTALCFLPPTNVIPDIPPHSAFVLMDEQHIVVAISETVLPLLNNFLSLTDKPLVDPNDWEHAIKQLIQILDIHIGNRACPPYLSATIARTSCKAVLQELGPLPLYTHKTFDKSTLALLHDQSQKIMLCATNNGRERASLRLLSSLLNLAWTEITQASMQTANLATQVQNTIACEYAVTTQVVACTEETKTINAYKLQLSTLPPEKKKKLQKKALHEAQLILYKMTGGSHLPHAIHTYDTACKALEQKRHELKKHLPHPQGSPLPKTQRATTSTSSVLQKRHDSLKIKASHLQTTLTKALPEAPRHLYAQRAYQTLDILEKSLQRAKSTLEDSCKEIQQNLDTINAFILSLPDEAHHT